MGKAQVQIEHPGFETVWAALQEIAERQKETDRIIIVIKGQGKKTSYGGAEARRNTGKKEEEEKRDVAFFPL